MRATPKAKKATDPLPKSTFIGRSAAVVFLGAEAVAVGVERYFWAIKLDEPS